MSKKISVQNAIRQILLNTDSSIFKFLLNWAGRQKFIKGISAAIAIISGITQAMILSVCLM